MSLDVQRWAENITSETFDLWKKGIWKPGFKVFYSPVYFKPKIIIVGHNPGGDEHSFDEDKLRYERRNFSSPLRHEYVYDDYAIARKMRDLFDGNIKLLETSVKLNLLFFRSKDLFEWRSIDVKLRNTFEKFSYSKFIEIIDFLKPSMLLLEGLKTYDLVKRIVSGFSSESNFLVSNRRIASKAVWNNILVYGIIHPTGSRIKKEEWNKLKQNFNMEINNLFSSK